MTAAPWLHGLSLEDKAARVFWVTVHGPAAHTPHDANRAAFGSDTPAEVIARHRPGGVVLFAWAGNTGHPEQVAALTGELRAAAGEVGYPLAVAIDEEGGRVTRLGRPATAFPSARAVAAAGDQPLALGRWHAAGAELAAVGVTANLAPVADLGHPANPILGDRTFADDPATVAAHAALAVRGLGDAGVAAVAKHFPGHGATVVDSHTDLPVVDLTRARLEPHLDAFRRLLAARPPAGIMTAHLLVGALDPARPATLSPAVLTRLLRDELGYRGAVLTDSLSMAGVRTRAGDPPVAEAALAAGADVLLTPPDLPGAVAAVCRAVRDGRIPEARLDEALLRAVPLAQPAAGDRSAPSGSTTAAIVGHPDHRALAADIARLAVAVVADPCGRVPLPPGPALVAGLAGSGARELADALTHIGRPVSLFEVPAPAGAGVGLEAAGQAHVDRTNPTSADPTTHDVGRLAAAARDGALVLVRRAPELDAAVQDALLAPLARRHPHGILIESGITAAAWVAGLDLTVLRTHGGCPTAMSAAAHVLRGRAPTR